MNPEAEVLLGCSAGAVRSKPLSSLLQTPAMGCRFASVEDMLAALQPNDGKRVTGAFLVERAEGGRRVIEVTCRRFTSESAEDAMIAVLRDVSELSERVAEAQRNEARFRTLSHALSDYAYVLRVDGRRRVQLEWATPTLLDVFDIQAAELETRIAWGKRIPHYERAKVLAHLRNLLANKTDSAEFRIVGKDQEVRWIANRARPHYDEQLRRVTYIYGAAHDITERKRLEEQRRRDQRIQSLLHKILRYSLEAPSLQEGLTQVLNLILSAPFLKLFHRGGIFLTDETQRRLVLTAQVNLPPALQSICAFVPFGRCLCGRAAETGQIQTASCVDERHENVYPGLAPHGHFNVPLVSEGKVLGVMVLYVEHGHRFEALEFSFLGAAADVVAGIIKRGQANELLRRQFNELLAVHSMTSTLNSARSLDEINAAALRTLVDGLRADRASILLFDHNGVMRFVAWNGLSDAYRAAVEGHSPWSADAQSAEPILIEDVAVDPSVAAIRSHVLGEGIRSLAFIPLLHGGRLLGKLTLYFNTPHSFSDEEVRVAKAVATHIAAAVARHHAEERRRAIERIVDNSQVVLFRWRPEPGWPVAFVSEQVRQFGYTPDDFVSGRIDYASIVHPDDLVRVRDEVRSYISTNTDRFRQEYRILTRDGKVHWVDDRSLVVRDNAGKINYVEGTILDITEQKQAQQALEASEEELRTLFVAMDDLVLVIDQEGVYRKIAPTHPDLLYRPAAELVGRRLHDVFPRKQADLFLGAIHQCLQSQQRTLLEYELTIGERKVPFLASVSPFSHDATLWIIRDISGLKKAQAEVEMLALAVKSLDECVSITDVDDRFIFVNESFERTYGYRREELLGKHLGVIRSPLNAPEHVAQILPATLAGGWHGELMNKRKDGTDFPISLTTAAVRDAEGNVVALIGVAQDITERKRAEQALKESEERFRLLAESSLTGIYLIHDQKFAYINQSFAATFGYTVEEIVNNLGPLDLTHPDDRPRVVENIRRRVAGEVEAVRYDFRGVKKDGTVIYVEVHGRRIEYAGKIGIIGTLVDITERKRAESLRLRLSQVLESIASDEPLPQILERLVHAIEEFVPDMKGSVLLLDASGKRLHHGAAPHLPEDYNTAIDGLLIGPRVGSCGTAAYEKRLVIVEDIQTDPLWADYREIAAKYGLRACWSQPIIDHEGTVLGTFALYYGQPRKPSEAELGLIITAANIAGIAIKRKRAEQALKESEERYRFLYNGTPSMFFTVDEHGTIVSVNNFGATYLGYTVDELVGTSVLTLFHGDDRAAVAEALQQCLKHPGATHTWRYRKRHKDGSVLWVEETASAVQMPGRSVQVLVVCTDISERVRMEAALRQSEERYRTFFEDDLTGDYISTPEGKLLECNPAFVKMFGFASREQALATSATVLYSDPKKREEFIQRVRAQKRLEYVETELRRVDGSPLYAIENVTGIFDERGELVMLRGYLFDDTRRRLLEQHLIQAQKLDSLGTLASGVAHDFNNILSIVVGHGSLLKRHAHHDQTVARHADAILSATERGVGLVRQILTFARRTESAFEELNVHALIHEHVKLLSETFPKTIEIALDLTSQSVLIQGDATQIHQVLLNLSVNARDAMPQGGKLTISTRVVPGSDLTKRFPEASARSYIQLCVSDTGIGMDEQTQQKVFEPFFTTKDRSKGTGLGLAVVYGVVQSHKGFIDLQSVPGEGTTFSLYFPLLMKTFATADRAQQVAVEDLRGSETLLLVEDEEMLLALMNDLLTAQGYHVLAAPDSETALRLYRKQHSRIDAVISDFGLPKFNGLELYRRLRSINPNVRMMIASGFIEPETKDLMLEEGILHVVAKPYRPDEVLRLLRKMFAQ